MLVAAMQKSIHDGALYLLPLLLGHLRCSGLLPRLAPRPGLPGPCPQLPAGVVVAALPAALAQEPVLVADQRQHVLQVQVCDRVGEARHLCQ